MTPALASFIASGLRTPLDVRVAAFARALAEETPGAEAVLFYGSNLRTGSLEGVLDFYVLTAGPRERGAWPRVGYQEREEGGATLRAKIATMRTATFAHAARAKGRDATIWARFVQPAALAWAADEAAGARAEDAVAAAAVSAAGFAALLGPDTGAADAYWRALFRATYATEFRVERPGREAAIVETHGDRLTALLPLAWEAAGTSYAQDGARFAPSLSPAQAADLARRWARARRWGKAINVGRLVRAAFTFDGAARYGAWKIERHTGVPVALTPWRERHPILAAPGVLWRVWRAQRG